MCASAYCCVHVPMYLCLLMCACAYWCVHVPSDVCICLLMSASAVSLDICSCTPASWLLLSGPLIYDCCCNACVHGHSSISRHMQLHLHILLYIKQCLRAGAGDLELSEELECRELRAELLRHSLILNLYRCILRYHYNMLPILSCIRNIHSLVLFYIRILILTMNETIRTTSNIHSLMLY